MWSIVFTKKADKKFYKLERPIQNRIQKFIDERLLLNPHYHSTLLVGEINFARARVGDYRIIIEIKDSELIILLIGIDHRKQIYTNL